MDRLTPTPPPIDTATVRRLLAARRKPRPLRDPSFGIEQGTVVADNGDGTLTVDLDAGGTLSECRYHATYLAPAAGDRVWIVKFGRQRWVLGGLEGDTTGPKPALEDHSHDGGVVPSDVSYRHVQSAPSATWTIDHNLGFRPGGITVISSAGDVVIGKIVSTTTTQLVLEFSAAFAGEAHLS